MQSPKDRNQYNFSLQFLIGVFALTKAFEGSVDYIQVMDENGKVDAAVSKGPAGLQDSRDVQVHVLRKGARCEGAQPAEAGQGRHIRPAGGAGGDPDRKRYARCGKDDCSCRTSGSTASFLARGMPLETFFIYWRGFEEGNIIPKEVGGLPVVVPVATQMPHAAGIAFAQKYKKNGCRSGRLCRRRRHIRRRLLRGAELRGGVQGAARYDNREQPVGHICAEKSARARPRRLRRRA